MQWAINYFADFIGLGIVADEGGVFWQARSERFCRRDVGAVHSRLGGLDSNLTMHWSRFHFHFRRDWGVGSSNWWSS